MAIRRSWTANFPVITTKLLWFESGSWWVKTATKCLNLTFNLGCIWFYILKGLEIPLKCKEDKDDNDDHPKWNENNNLKSEIRVNNNCRRQMKSKTTTESNMNYISQL